MELEKEKIILNVKLGIVLQEFSHACCHVPGAYLFCLLVRYLWKFMP